tara:strand:+ start:6442 stop:6858 length:417 start_codon:yes stop_codon:yes gene_type:complete
MYGKKVKLRLIFVFSLLASVILLVFIVLNLLKDNIIYFKSPSEVKQLSEIIKKKIRVGGMVKKNSIKLERENISFIITDFKNDLRVSFSGSVPNLFQEEKGVVAEGYLKDQNFFIADKILAKHDENYMPPEVKKSLED